MPITTTMLSLSRQILMLSLFLLLMVVVIRNDIPDPFFVSGFVIPQNCHYNYHRHHDHDKISTSTTVLQMVASKGPPRTTTADDSTTTNNNDDNEENNDDDNINEIRINQEQFRSFLEECIATSMKDPNHLPKLMANNIELMMSLHGIDGTEVIEELMAASSSNQERQQIANVIEVVLEFAEELVDFSVNLDDHNKHLLGEIIRIMTNPKQTSLQREEQLDEWLSQEKHNFTPGFLRHLEGECSRIENAPKPTKDSLRLLEIIRIIQTRVLEELGRDIGNDDGEAALVLGQLMGYETITEMIGVLDAGLKVRGIEFAIEMKDLTMEALDGFTRVPGGVDPDLIERVTKIHHRLEDYLDESNQFM